MLPQQISDLDVRLGMPSGEHDPPVQRLSAPEASTALTASATSVPARIMALTDFMHENGL